MMTTSAQRLRQKLLDLAIRGKLVPQNPKDESAEKLLARMREAKSHAEAQSRRGRATSMKSPPSIPDDEKPFEIPSNWAWCRLGEVIELLSGQDFPPSRYSDDVAKGLPYITGASNFGSDGIIENRWTPEPTVISKCGDFLLTCKGSGVGKTAIMNLPEAHIARQIMALRPSEGLDSGYLAAYIRANFDFLRQAANGLIPGIQRSVVLSMILPLSPLAEQRRIVAALDTLLKEVDAVAAGAKRIAALKDRARAKILDLAIRGKLVKQDAADEPAEKLLARIREERNAGRGTRPACPHSRSNGKHVVGMNAGERGRSPLPISDDEKPFDIPQGWAWCRLGGISDVQLGKMLDAKKNIGKECRYLANISVRWGGFDLKDLRTTFFTDDEVEKFSLRENDLLVCEGGVPGRCAVWRERDTDIKYQKAIHRVRPYAINADYLQHYFEAIHDRPFFTSHFTGSTIHHLPREVLLNLPIPLPPLAEQKRIVAKVDEMLAACDNLASEA